MSISSASCAWPASRSFRRGDDRDRTAAECAVRRAARVGAGEQPRRYSTSSSTMETYAVRVSRASRAKCLPDSVEILQGLSAGDRLILTDNRAWGRPRPNSSDRRGSNVMNQNQTGRVIKLSGRHEGVSRGRCRDACLVGHSPRDSTRATTCRSKGRPAAGNRRCSRSSHCWMDRPRGATC